MDRCDAATFNAALGPGTCVRTAGGITFERFLSELAQTGTVGAWSFTPRVIHVHEEIDLPVVNVGGEAHTFTEVEEFGGGIVPELNQLTGLITVAPECAALAGTDFSFLAISSGGVALNLGCWRSESL